MKQIFAMLFAVAVFIVAVAAEAATLRSEAVIQGDRVTLGDLFDGLPPDQAGTAIARAPALGRTVSLGAPVERIAGAYAWLRRAELALGLLGSPQAVMPEHAEGQIAVARTMGYAESDAARALARFLYDWRAVRDQAHETVDRIRREMGT